MSSIPKIRIEFPTATDHPFAVAGRELLTYYDTYQRARQVDGNAQHLETLKAHFVNTPPPREIGFVSVVNGRSIKATLRSRGYRFVPSRARKLWVKQVPASLMAAEIMALLRAIER